MLVGSLLYVVAPHGTPERAVHGTRAVPPHRARETAPRRPVPVIAIVIDDLGLSAARTRDAIALPRAVTLSFLPYPDETPALSRAAHRAGHEVIVHLPMQPEGTEDPGPMALKVGLGARELTRRVNWALARVSGYDGVNNHMGSRFTASASALRPVMRDLAAHHLFFLDSRTTPDTVVVPLAHAFGIESAGRDVFLDDTQTPDYVARQLDETMRVAREKGVAIAIGHPHPVTLAVLKTWTAHIAARGYRLVPVSVAIPLKTEWEPRRMTAANVPHSGR